MRINAANKLINEEVCLPVDAKQISSRNIQNTDCISNSAATTATAAVAAAATTTTTTRIKSTPTKAPTTVSPITITRISPSKKLQFQKLQLIQNTPEKQQQQQHQQQHHHQQQHQQQQQHHHQQQQQRPVQQQQENKKEKEKRQETEAKKIPEHWLKKSERTTVFETVDLFDTDPEEGYEDCTYISPPALYPIVIEYVNGVPIRPGTEDQPDLSNTQKEGKESLDKDDKKTNEQEQKATTSAPTPAKRRRRKGSKKRSPRGAAVNGRLATLRIRKGRETGDEGGGIPENDEDVQPQKAEEQQQQQKQEVVEPTPALPGIPSHLDPGFLNRIDVLECEPKPPARKRKRINSLTPTIHVTTRKRGASSTSINSNSSSNNNNSNNNSSNNNNSKIALTIDESSPDHLGINKFGNVSPLINKSPSPAVDGPGSSAGGRLSAGRASGRTAAGRAVASKQQQQQTQKPPTPPPFQINYNQQKQQQQQQQQQQRQKKKSRMSLYERPFDGAGSRGHGVSNGYLSSTRSGTAGGSILADPNCPGNDPHIDLASQYSYMSSNATQSTSTSGLGSSLTGSIGSSALGVGGGTNGTLATLNHAPSMATLCNIGNTCYLNSVVYTLRFAPQFLHNLHHLIYDLSHIQQSIAVRQRVKTSSLGRGGIISALHMDGAGRSWSNKDLATQDHHSGGGTSTAILPSSVVGGGGGTMTGGCSGNGQKASHQLLTERLHDLYQSLHRNEATESTEPFHADTLLHAVQDVSAIFEGNQQQDAHEFLMCVLNSIRETCQTLIKAIAEYPDIIVNGIGQPDELEALERELAGNINQQQQQTSNSNSNANASSLSTTTIASNIIKPSFFSRKPKRKDESKSSKNSSTRLLQSPLKDGSAGGGGGVGGVASSSSNSLFYLNTVDLMGASTSSASTSTTTLPSATASTSAAAAKAAAAAAAAGAGGDTVDATDAQIALLKDKERLAEKIRELGLDFFSEDFEGITVSTTKCLSCETVTEQKESMIDIAVPVPISGYESTDYTEKPSSFIQNSCITREYFRGENKYRCEKCTGYTEAIRSISYEVLPRLLVIQLSRFSGGMEKINSYIPTSFTLQCFCSKCCDLDDGDKLHVYKLYSVITHVGATMSVGHYIAYTCALDWTQEYVNCPKDRRTATAQSKASTHANTNGGGGGGNQTNAPPAQSSTSTTSSAASVLASSGTSLMKKMKLVRSKASSSGDITKGIKQLNGLLSSNNANNAANNTKSTVTNGINRLNIAAAAAAAAAASSNTTCHSLTCCATRLCNAAHQQQQMQQFASSGSDLSEESLQNGVNMHYTNASGNNNNNNNNTNSNNNMNMNNNNGGIGMTYPSGYGSTGRGGSGYYKSAPPTSGNSSEPIWYMCDDDKIKAMTQREFEELLSPSRKITITPYLLFYARFDLRSSSAANKQKTSTTATAGAASSTAAGASTWASVGSQSSASWSSESPTTSGSKM